eukprot:GHVU01072402.1.p1 GENE.GHVU01072402.1~~GHVU01072402.1.p1  ORF type:complete len:691 (+),score=160.21 GHVU01072402.1:32-2074(+)
MSNRGKNDDDGEIGTTGAASTIARKTTVKNKTAAPVQISAEQLIREAVERQSDEVVPPRQRIVDEDELQEVRARKRREFEDLLRRNRMHIGTWIKYALWEGAQKDFRRARSVFERALAIDYQNASLWLKYIEMEMQNKFVNSARNLYDRVTQLLPRVDQFWYKYAYMEEVLGNFAGSRSIYERWMGWNPDDHGWMFYIRFEERCRELDRARKVFERFLSNAPSQSSFLKFCKFEEKHKDIERARAGYEKAIELLRADELDEHFYIKFAQFEQRQREMDRVRAIYHQALQRLPKDTSEELFRLYTAFQKQFGAKEEIESAILQRRRVQYEAELQESPTNYDVWFDYIRLEESEGSVERIRNLYERAVGAVPPLMEKRYWRRYVYLWIYYALFEEVEAADVERCRLVYTKALEVVPHSKFSFAKLWSYFAEFEVRQLELDKARKVYGLAIAKCGKEKIFTSYANLELRLGNIDRCRKIYTKFTETHATNPRAWVAFVELEIMAEEVERARALCEIAVSMEVMDTPELIWKTYIDMEVEAGETDRARRLYERLLAKTRHHKVYRSFSEFEAAQAGDMENARRVLRSGLQHCKDNELKEERANLMKHWLQLEQTYGDEKSAAEVRAKMPHTRTLKRNLVGADGTSQGWEEYSDYVFPEDTVAAANMILKAAQAWKRHKRVEGVA